MDYKEKAAKAQKLFDAARVILENEEATAEDRAKVPEMIEDAKALKAEAFQLKEILDAGVAQLLAEEQQKQDDLGKDDPKASGKVGEFKSFEEFVVAVWYQMNPNPILRKNDPRLEWFTERDVKTQEGKTMVESVGASGGFLVPPEYRAEMYAALPEGAIVRPRASIIRMARRQVNIPVLDQTQTLGAGKPTWFGGLLFYWTEEATEKTDTDAKFREIGLVAHKLIGYTTASDELVADSAISLGDFLSGPLGFVGGVRWNEDYTFLQGTGVGQPLGVINAGATITVARATAGTVTYADLVNMLEAFLPTGRGVWVISQTVMSNLMTMSGPAGNPAYLWGDATTGRPDRLLGYPVIWTEKLPGVGTTGDVLLADFQYYLLGDRQAFTIDTTIYDKWAFDKTSWRIVHRVDGQPWLSAPITYQDQATQISPFVILGGVAT